MWYSRPVNAGAELIDGSSTSRDRLTTWGNVPLDIRKDWQAGKLTSADLEIVGTGPGCVTRRKGVAFLQREVMTEIDEKTTELIMAGYAVEVSGTTYTFSMASYAQVNLNTIAVRFAAGQDPFPVKIRLLDAIETTPGTWRYYVTLTTAGQLNTLLQAKQAHVDGREHEGWNLKEQALAATDTATLEAIRATNNARS